MLEYIIKINFDIYVGYVDDIEYIYEDIGDFMFIIII